jgi:hypothetical protein
MPSNKFLAASKKPSTYRASTFQSPLAGGKNTWRYGYGLYRSAYSAIIFASSAARSSWSMRRLYARGVEAASARTAYNGLTRG